VQQGEGGEQRGAEGRGYVTNCKAEVGTANKLLVYTMYTVGRQNSMTIYIHLLPKQAAYKTS